MASADRAADPPEPGLLGRVLLTIVIAIGVAAVLAAIAAIGYAAYIAFTAARATTDGGFWSTLHVLFLWPVLTIAVVLDWIIPTTWFATVIDQAFDHPIALLVAIHAIAFFAWISIIGGRSD